MLKDLIRKIVSKTAKVVTLSASNTSVGDFVLRKTDYGIVRVEFSVVQKISERAMSNLRGVHDSQISVEKPASTVTPLKIILTMTLEDGCSAPKAAETADKAINDALKDSLGLEFYVPVAVKVRQIEQPVVTKRRRVR